MAKVEPYKPTKKKVNKQNIALSREKLFSLLLARGEKYRVVPRAKRSALPHFGVRVRDQVRKNAHITARAFGYESADEMMEVLFARAYAR